MITTAAVTRRSSVARRAAEGTVAAYLWEESSRVAGRARPAARRWAPGREPRRPAGTPGAQRGERGRTR